MFNFRKSFAAAKSLFTSSGSATFLLSALITTDNFFVPPSSPSESSSSESKSGKDDCSELKRLSHSLLVRSMIFEAGDETLLPAPSEAVVGFGVFESFVGDATEKLLALGTVELSVAPLLAFTSGAVTIAVVVVLVVVASFSTETGGTEAERT